MAQAPGQDSITQTIRRLERDRRAAHLSGDATRLAEILADDFVDIGANGVRRTKQQNVADTRARVIQWTTLTVCNEQVQVFDSTTAVVTGEQVGVGSYNGQPFNRRVVYLRVYLKRGGRWQNVAAQNALRSPSEAVATQPPDTSGPPPSTVRVITPPAAPADTALFRHVVPGAPVLVELTKKSRRVSLDTLFVYSRTEQHGWPYAGQPIDTTFEALFQPFYPELAFPHDEPEVFAATRVVLDARHIAYLLRVPGMYEPSRVDLWVYDAGQMRFAAPIEVAESWGDAGCGFSLESVLMHAPTGVVELISHQNTGCMDIETGKVTSNDDVMWVRTWGPQGFSARRVTVDSLLTKVVQTQRERAIR